MASHKTITLSIFVLILLLACGLGFMAVFGNFDTNEGWYANDLFLVSQGMRPYEDFFYHRLPLFLYSFVPFQSFISIDWITLRIFSALFLWLAACGLVWLLWGRVRPALICLAIGLLCVNIHGLHIFATVQVYSIVAFFYIVILLVVEKVRTAWLSVLFFACLCVVAQWMRYPIDYLPFVFFLYLFVVFWGRWSLMLLGLVVYVSLHAFLLSQFASEKFFHHIIFGMNPFQYLQGELPKLEFGSMAWLRYKSDWLLSGVRWFFPLLLLGFPLLVVFFSRYKFRFWLNRSFLAKHRGAWLAFLLVTGNTSMYLLAPEGHPVQLYYIFPVLLYLLCHLLDWGFSFSPPMPRYAFSTMTFVLVLSAPWLHDRDVRLSSTARDTAIVAQIATELKKHCSAGEELLTFTPLVAMESSMRVTPGLEFETFSYFDSLSTSEAAQYGLMNRELLVQRVQEKQPCAIHLDNRFHQTQGNAARLRAMQKDFLRTVTFHYLPPSSLAETGWEALRGPVFLYFRRES